MRKYFEGQILIENNELQITWDIESEGNIMLYYHSSKKPQVLNLEEWENKVISITPGSHYISLQHLLVAK